MNRILFDESEWRSGELLRLDGDRARHIREVLRAEAGDVLKLGRVNGPRMRGRVVAMSGGEVFLALEEEEGRPECPRVDLLLALPRPKVLKRLLPQIAALGVGRLYLTNAARVERNYFDTHVLHADFLREALLEGLVQAGDTLLPEVRVIRELKPFLEDDVPELSLGMEKILFHPRGAEDRGLREAAREERVLAAIGPEGGWVPFELDLFGAAGFRRVSLSERILRSDTAVIGALALAGHWINGS